MGAADVVGVSKLGVAVLDFSLLKSSTTTLSFLSDEEEVGLAGGGDRRLFPSSPCLVTTRGTNIVVILIGAHRPRVAGRQSLRS